MACNGPGRECGQEGKGRGQPDTVALQMTGRQRGHCPLCGAFLREDGGCTRCDHVNEDAALEWLGSAILNAPSTSEWIERTPDLQRALDNAMVAYSSPDAESGAATLREALLDAPRDQDRFHMTPFLRKALAELGGDRREASIPSRYTRGAFQVEEYVQRYGAAFEDLPRFRGNAWRCDGGFVPRGSAGDVVRYEQEELGNDNGVPEELLPYLDGVPASRLVWVCRSREDALRYEDFGEMEEWTLESGAVIVGQDTDEGYWVLNLSLGGSE